MSVSVIIVTFNSGDLLVRCLRHLAKQTVRPEQVLVVDNASTDSTCELIKGFEGITVFRLEKNLGFAAGNNRALSECKTPFVALLNPDAFPEPDWLEKLLEAAEKYPEHAMFGSRLIAAGNPLLLDGDGDHYHISGIAWREGYMRRVGPAEEPWETFSPCAAAAMYRTDALRDVGGFDTDLFCYLEDVDLGFRLRLAGQRCLQVPQAVVHHVGAATTGGQQGEFATYHGHRNLIWVYFKNMPSYLFWLFLPLHVLVNIAGVVLCIQRGQGKTVMRAKLDAVKGIRKAWRKRSRIQRFRRTSTLQILKVLDKRVVR